MLGENRPTKGKGKIPEIRFRCNLKLCNPSQVFIRVQSTFANNIQDWGISETLNGNPLNLTYFDREFCIPFIVGYDHCQRVRITLFGGDDLKVGKGYPLGFCELSLMEIAGQPSNVPVLMQGEAAIAQLTFVCNIYTIRQDFDLTSMDPISSLGFCHSAPTLEKLRSKKRSFVENRSSFTLELFGKDLFRAQVPDQKKSKSKKGKLSSSFMDSDLPSSSDDPQNIISKFLSMVKIKKLQFSIRVYVTHDPVPEEMFFYDDIELEELDSWKMVYATCRTDFFKPSIHEHSPEIAEDVLIGEGGWQKDTNWTVAFVILLHYTTTTGQEGIQPMSARIENLCSYMQTLQEYLSVKKRELRQKGQAHLRQVLQGQDAAASLPAASSKHNASSKKQPEAVKIVFGDRSSSTSRFNDLTSTLLQSTVRSITSSAMADTQQSPSISSSPNAKRPSMMMRRFRSLHKHHKSGIQDTTVFSSQSHIIGPGDHDPHVTGEGSESTVDEFTQTLHAFLTIIRKTMIRPLSFQMHARQDLQIVVAGPKYEEKIHALFQQCYEDWSKKMTVPFQYAMKMFQEASENAYELLYLQSSGQQLAPVVLIDMFHPCLQQTLNQHLQDKYRQNHHSSGAHTSLNNSTNKLSISRHSCQVLHALLTFYETLFPLFPQGRNLRILAGGNIRTPKINPETSKIQMAPNPGWFQSWIPVAGTSTDTRDTSNLNKDDDDDTDTTSGHSQYVRKKGYPYVAELLMVQPTTQQKLRAVKDKKSQKDPRTTFPLQGALCMCETPMSQVEDDANDAETSAKKEEKFEDNLAQLQLWQRVVSQRGDGTTLQLTEDRYQEYATELFYGDAKDLVRGFMEATEAYVPVTDAHVKQYSTTTTTSSANTSPNKRHSRGTQLSNNSEKNTVNSADNNNNNNNNRNAANATNGIDRGNRRRRLALYTGTDYEPDLTYEDILDSQIDLVPCIGKNHDFAALRVLLSSVGHTHNRHTHQLAEKNREEEEREAGQQWRTTMTQPSSFSSGMVTPVVWILGRSPPLRNKFHSDITQNVLKNRVEDLCFREFPLHRRDKCLIIVLAAEHRYDFPVLDKHGHVVEELRAIAHPFEEFHRILGQVLQQRRREYLTKRSNVTAKTTLPSSSSSSKKSNERDEAMFVPENIFVIHQYAFSEVLARALEYEILNDPSLRPSSSPSHQRRSSSNNNSNNSNNNNNNSNNNSSKVPRHHRALSPQHRASFQTDAASSPTTSSFSSSSSLSHHHHKLPRLSSIKAILTTIFSQGPHTVDVHTIDEILSTGEEILDRHVRRAEKAEDIERKLLEHPAATAGNHSVLGLMLEPEKLAVQAMQEVRTRASTLIRRVSLDRTSGGNNKQQNEDGSEDDEKATRKKDVIRDFAHLTAIKERFDAAILQVVRKQYHHIAVSILRSSSSTAGTAESVSSRRPVSSMVSTGSKMSKPLKSAPPAPETTSDSTLFSWISSPVVASSASPTSGADDTTAVSPPWALSWMPFLSPTNHSPKPEEMDMVPIQPEPSTTADVKLRPPPLRIPPPVPLVEERKDDPEEAGNKENSLGNKKKSVWKNIRNSFLSRSALLIKKTNDQPATSDASIQPRD